MEQSHHILEQYSSTYKYTSIFFFLNGPIIYLLFIYVARAVARSCLVRLLLYRVLQHAVLLLLHLIRTIAAPNKDEVRALSQATQHSSSKIEENPIARVFKKPRAGISNRARAIGIFLLFLS